jgi:hypothetical protein
MTRKQVLLSESAHVRLSEESDLNDLYISIGQLEQSAEKRAAYKWKIGLNYTTPQLVFLDESSVDRRTTNRKCGYASQGKRAIAAGPFTRGTRYTCDSL